MRHRRTTTPESGAAMRVHWPASSAMIALDSGRPALRVHWPASSATIVLDSGRLSATIAHASRAEGRRFATARGAIQRPTLVRPFPAGFATSAQGGRRHATIRARRRPTVCDHARLRAPTRAPSCARVAPPHAAVAWSLAAEEQKIHGRETINTNCGRNHQSGPRPETRLLRQPALEGLTRSARTDSPRRIGRKRFYGEAAAAAAAAAAACREEGGRRPMLDSIGYPRMSASGESSTTMHRLLHASGSHPIPTPYDPQMSTLVNGTVAGDRWIERAGFVVLNAGDCLRVEIC
ncbi:hypothetical protein F511_30041 [Dorcoceras hygrometricum]|uniref:Uncharacterized protein n=1 Tax=Dorcoceras hygrometricum TaxID=472368 RepID=A0A2Z7CYG9_9LAMI|nr:hypothetical protein F511_30041 [Dorcoceras hygrometricum]